MRRAWPLLVLAALLAGCSDDAEGGADWLDAAVPVVDREAASLGDTLSETLGGAAEVGPTEYDLCSSAPVEGLRYVAGGRLRDADPDPTLDAATAAAADAGWEVGDTSPAEGFLAESVALSRGGLDTRLSVEDGVVAWSSQSSCVRVTPGEANRRVGP